MRNNYSFKNIKQVPAACIYVGEKHPESCLQAGAAELVYQISTLAQTCSWKLLPNSDRRSCLQTSRALNFETVTKQFYKLGYWTHPTNKPILMSDTHLRSRWFNSQPFYFQVTTLGKLFKHKLAPDKRWWCPGWEVKVYNGLASHWPWHNQFIHLQSYRLKGLDRVMISWSSCVRSTSGLVDYHLAPT